MKTRTSIFGRLRYYFKWLGCWFLGEEQPDPPALPPPKLADLSMLVASVFVREPNGSRTNIENHLEQQLILRSAKVVIANQKVGMAIIKDGEFHPLATDANCSFVGTLTVKRDTIIVVQKSRGRKEEIEGVWFVLSFRLFGSDGTILVSGTAEEEAEADMVSYDEEMRSLAVKAIAYLDTTDVWASVVIPTTSADV